ncbi:SLIT1 [Cordylochernes scorpioides]|uniref:SLIT1 n=1 Tax=Cordylochernes scorpioides TaxID=51811 RepID=A0ABY6LCC2_9ARAC|nr:SLIT1 [Cordylochernes scorpioides]
MLRNNHLSYVANDSFTDLNSLQILSLNDNKIRCVAGGAFNNLPALTTLNVVSNPLSCNCHSRGFSEWLQRTSVVTGNPRCHSPSRLKDVPLQDVEPGDLICEDGMTTRMSSNSVCLN